MQRAVERAEQLKEEAVQAAVLALWKHQHGEALYTVQALMRQEERFAGEKGIARTHFEKTVFPATERFLAVLLLLTQGNVETQFRFLAADEKEQARLIDWVLTGGGADALLEKHRE